MAEYIQGEYFFLPQEHVLFGVGSLAKLANEVKVMGGQRVFVVTGHSLATQTDVVQKVEQALGSLHVGTFADIHQHTPKSDVARAVEQVHKLNADVLLSLGGGSVIDGTKAIAMKLSVEHGNFLPHIAIPTTLSAAEFSHLVGVTDEEQNIKAGFAHVQVTPTSVLMDASLTLSTPLQLWLSTGIRALDHAVETLYAPGAHPINDVLALEAIDRLFKYLPQSKYYPEDLAVRTELQLAAWMSFFGEVNTPMGLSHNLGRRIGASYNVPHGITSCITLPHVMRAMASTHASALAPIARRQGLVDSSASDQDAARSAADAVSALIQRLGLPQRLRDVGVPADELRKIAETTSSQSLKVDEIEALLKEMW
ncbi:iron-containing alcohol dehydrogenase [Dictyobacter kobayashii]|uniref:Maleylacetate reductase n=1 Tax=Dictyobacter kobayashii TaxID=2014872 RepID=A0A402AYD9_9CHLR|nr:iron-containing alcohol dehydrogenase [Dictyobacter kobayashii]GCE24087.1 maleylacetate reductase [Dictyobacter kobayashii]